MKKIHFNIQLAFLFFFFTTIQVANATELKQVRVGVLKFGTVNWTLNVIKHHQLDKKYDFDLKVIPLGSKNASHVSIQGGASDMIVSDWVWVSRQRSDNRKYTFVPYSNATGSLMVKKDSGINSIADLKNKKLGIAGGPVDKSWLFLRAFTQRKLGKDLKEFVVPTYVAPPLLNKLAQRDELDAALNFWHYSARLKASGFKSLLNVPEVLNELGVKSSIPVIGWVFSEKWADENTSLVKNFVAATKDAQKLLLESDQEWLRIKKLMKAKDETIFLSLKDAFRKGISHCFGEQEKQSAKLVFEILAKQGGKELVGNATELDSGTFWKNYNAPACKSIN